MKSLQHIGFEISEKNEEEVVLKRVLSTKNGKRRIDVENSLPKLSIQFFDTDELEHLQEIASTITEHIVAKRRKASLRLRIMSLFKD